MLEVPHVRRDIAVDTVCVDHASAMRELLRVQTIGRGWGLTNTHRLRELSIADGLLAIMGGAMLSVLIDSPTSSCCSAVTPTALRGAPARWGSFQQPVERLCDDILHHINEGHRVPRRCRASWLLENDQDLQRRITRLRTSYFSLSPHDEA